MAWDVREGHREESKGHHRPEDMMLEGDVGLPKQPELKVAKTEVLLFNCFFLMLFDVVVVLLMLIVWFVIFLLLFEIIIIIIF